MAAGDEDLLGLIQQVREMGGGNIMTGAITAVEGAALEHMDQIGREIEHKSTNDWPSREEAQDRINRMSAEEKREQFHSARARIVDNIASLLVAYHEMALLDKGTDEFVVGARTLIVSLHNPVIQESLLIPVAEPWEEDAREFFREFSAVLWGFVEVTAGEQGAYYGAYLDYLATHWDMSPEELRDMLFGE